MKSIESLGAAGEVTGSLHLLTADDDSQIMVDFGMFQGSPDAYSKNFKLPGIDVKKLKGVLITHAHLDHCGRTGLLPQMGYEGKLYMTEPTARIMPYMLHDTINIARYDGVEPPYTTEDVEDVLSRIETHPYGEKFNVGNFTAVFRDAGHVLGSAIIKLTEKGPRGGGQSILFSGDLGNSHYASLVNPVDYINHAEHVVMEHTYGGRNHSDDDPQEQLLDAVQSIEKRGEGTVLMATFAYDRAQKILHMIHNLKRSGSISKNTPVFISTPLGIRLTEVYRSFIKTPYISDELSEYDKDPFTFPGLNISWTNADDERIFGIEGPKVVIASSGMMSAGRVRKHALSVLPDKKSILMLTGHAASDSLSGEIARGEKEVLIDDELVPVRSGILRMGNLSAHMDQRQLLNWLRFIDGVRKVHLIHGERWQGEVFADHVREELGIYDVTNPIAPGEVVKL